LRRYIGKVEVEELKEEMKGRRELFRKKRMKESVDLSSVRLALLVDPCLLVIQTSAEKRGET
jgi:hypothetical protein